MSVRPRILPGRLLSGGVRFRYRLVYAAAVVLFLWCVLQFHQRDSGFSSLISIGETLDASKVKALRESPHYVYEGLPGYDGAYYVQLALYPTLDNPELRDAIDNLPYRARRILFCWVAWGLGLGNPPWIIQAHALLNVLCWLALAGVLLRWFPPTDGQNCFRWIAVMFSHGLCMSVRHSLVDGPSVLLVATAMCWLESGRRRAGAITLALAGLGKETSLLTAAGLDFDWRRPRTWGRTGVAIVLIALPLILWMTYVRLKFGPAEDPGMGNFTLPFAGFVEKVAATWREARSPDDVPVYWATLAVTFALAVQWLFLILRWRPADRWWRVGVAFAVMMAFLSTPVWEGFPGAATRVLLPMTLAFNILVPRAGRWWPVLLAGNLTLAASVFEFTPPHEFYVVRGVRSLRSELQVGFGSGWHGPEHHLGQRWRWTVDRAELRLINSNPEPVRVTIRGHASSVTEPRHLSVTAQGRVLWSETVEGLPRVMQFDVTLPAGETVLVFAGDRPAEKVGTDPRDLAFRLANFQIVVSRVEPAR